MRFVRLSVAITALLAFVATAVPAGAQTEDAPVETEETTETIEVTVNTNGHSAEATASSTSEITIARAGAGNPIRHSNNGPVYACYFAEDYSGHPTNFVADTAAPDLKVGTTYWRVCFDGGVVADDDIALWTVNGWELGGTTETQLLQSLDNDVLDAYAIELEFSPADAQITGVETWIYSESRTNIAAVYATAGGVSAAVRARLENVEITPDSNEPGERFLCTSFGKWAPASVADCSHTYFVQPDSGTYTMETTTTWIVEEFTPTTGWNERAERIVIEQAYDVDVIDLEAVIGR